MITRQLELGLDNRQGGRPGTNRRRHSGRASWWFDRMRGAVEGTRDSDPSLPMDQIPPTQGRQRHS